jgi:hypothetical protein
MKVDLQRDTLFLTLAGSQAHGTARVGSDVDLRGVCVAPLALRVSLFQRFEQHEGPLEGALWARVRQALEAHPTAAQGLQVKTECVVFDVAKFLSLCASANPNALEVLFADRRDWLYATPQWERLYAQRHRFLSKQVQQTYVGYALAQLKKIRTHRAWLLSPPSHAPTRAEFGLPETGTLNREDRDRLEQGLADKVRSYGLDSLEMPRPLRLALQERLQAFWLDTLGVTEAELEDGLRDTAIHALQLPPSVVTALSAERKYRSALRQWESYQAWKTEQNPARAQLEERWGYDTKHAMHLVRLMQTGLELLLTGELHVRRADAGKLNDLRDGALSFEALMELAERLQAEMKAAATTTTLAEDVDRDVIDALALL